ncbi:MAG TPA: protein-L-isoaspartate(D-aspartate) O-methyltransferase [Pirellulales bacterium]
MIPRASATAAIRAAMFALLLAATFASRCMGANNFDAQRQQMVNREIVAAGIKDPRVVQAMRDTPRHEFVNVPTRANAYFDMALPIGQGQTISPPFVVAYMTEQLLPQPTDTVLEIGTGSGYQAAVLSPLVKDVYTIEIVKPLGERAARTLKRLKYANVHAKVGDGYQGWPENAPFDKIIVTCSPEHVPPKLVEQLREGGRMIVPVGERYQQTLYLFQKKDGKLTKIALLPTLFVPMTGKAEEGRIELPDPAHPSIANGGFEKYVKVQPDAGVEKPDDNKPSTDTAAGAKPDEDGELSPVGWHYQRQAHLEEADDAPEGKHVLTFSNSEPGRASLALQGLAVDGRKVRELNVSVWVKAKNVRPGPSKEQEAMISFTFYDENRAQIGFTWLGPWRDSFAWRRVTERVSIPGRAREAIVRIGLTGATGELSLDDLRVEVAH